MSKIKVAIADDHLLVRQGLSQLINLESDIEVIKLLANGQEMVDFLEYSKEIPDIAILDINMPVLDGISTIKTFAQKGINVKVIFVTFHTEKEYIIETMKLGAKGYILKDADSDVLANAIREVYNGNIYIQPNIGNEFVTDGEFNDEVISRIENPDGLTNREIEVLRLIAQGMINKEIGNKLFISEKTVKNHVSNIFRKIDVADRTQAAIYAINNKIV